MTPDWVLTLLYWIHMLATVLWIGGLSLLIVFVIPLSKRLLSVEQQTLFIEQIQKRFDPIAWFCVILLLATGMFQMSSNPNYTGLLEISNRWSVAILTKHLVFLGMIGINAVLTWYVLPGLKRMALLQARGLEAPESAKLQLREIWLLRLNLALGILVLGLTALARVS